MGPIGPPPLDVAENFPYARHRSHTFVQPLPNTMFHGLGADAGMLAAKPRDNIRPRNSFDFNDPCMGTTQHGLNQMERDTYGPGDHAAELRNSRYGLNRSQY